MLMDYIENKFEDGEPIFLSELPYKNMVALRQEMKKLTDEGKLIRVYNGVYYKQYTTILHTAGKMSIIKFIEKKFLVSDKKTIGYISGLGLCNKYGFTTQVPAVFEITSNTATTKQRKLLVCGYKIIVYKPIVKITNENVNEVEFLDLITNIDKYSEIRGTKLKEKLKELASSNNINFDLIKEYLPLYPNRTYKNLYIGGLMNELV